MPSCSIKVETVMQFAWKLSSATWLFIAGFKCYSLIVDFWTSGPPLVQIEAGHTILLLLLLFE